MSEMIPFEGKVPAYLQNRQGVSINKEVVTGAQFPQLKIKGKVFSLSRDGVNTPLMVDFDGDKIPAPTLQIVVLRANKKSRTFYEGSYEEGESDGAPPTCFSMDGVEPSDFSQSKQSPKCATCPQAVWGTKLRDDGTAGEGTRCSVNTRLAITTPDKIGTEKSEYLLRVPAGSRKNFNEMVKLADTRSIPYNALIVKISFDPEAPAPKLIFKPIGLLDDAQFSAAEKAYGSDIVKDIVGLGDKAPALPAPIPQGGVDASELDEALAARAAKAPATTPVQPKMTVPPMPPRTATAPPATASKPVVAKPVVAATTTPGPSQVVHDDILADLNELLTGATDD